MAGVFAGSIEEAGSAGVQSRRAAKKVAKARALG
jgi:hypothetical protein